jgi:hypothetical protein
MADFPLEITRLGKSMTKRLSGGIWLAFPVLLGGGTAELRAADPAFCQQYSRAALSQVHAGLSNPRCAARLQGSRWSSDFAVHYQWCLGVSDADAGSERDARTDYLRSCR